MRIDYTGKKEDDKRRFACISWEEKEESLAEKVLASLEANTLYHADCFGTGDQSCAYIKVEDNRDYKELVELYKEAKQESLSKIFAEIEDTARLFSRQNEKDCSNYDYAKVYDRCTQFINYASVKIKLLDKMHKNEVRIWIYQFKSEKAAVYPLMQETAEKEVPSQDEKYKAFATVKDGEKEWDVLIYSGYETLEDASNGIKKFLDKGYDVIKTWIEKDGKVVDVTGHSLSQKIGQAENIIKTAMKEQREGKTSFHER